MENIPVFKKYVIVNVVMIYWHGMMFFTGVMGFGSASGSPSKMVMIQALLLFSIIGASPNLFVFLHSLIKKKDVKENALWAGVFFLIVVISYFIAFSSVL